MAGYSGNLEKCSNCKKQFVKGEPVIIGKIIKTDEEVGFCSRDCQVMYCFIVKKEIVGNSKIYNGK